MSILPPEAKRGGQNPSAINNLYRRPTYQWKSQYSGAPVFFLCARRHAIRDPAAARRQLFDGSKLLTTFLLLRGSGTLPGQHIESHFSLGEVCPRIDGFKLAFQQRPLRIQ